jgi:uracil-DNA glycosylase
MRTKAIFAGVHPQFNNFMAEVQIEASWKAVLADVFEMPYFQEVAGVLRQAKAQGKVIYPPGSLIFNAFNATPFPDVRVVILGQDPYHNPGEAMGLCFSVPRGIKTPPSLTNIYKELNSDLGLPIPAHGDLSAWTRQGVFLLNAILTVERNQPASHQKIGWQDFTNEVIRRLSDRRDNLVFMLWGNYARKKAELIDAGRHLILEAAHPSPLARDAFRGCKHFSKANTYLEAHGYGPVDWRLGD